MKIKSLKVLTVLMLSTGKVLAFPWMPSESAKPRQEIQTQQLGQSINFSGHWEGSCNKQPTALLTIEHKADQIILDDGIMREKHDIGTINSQSKSKDPLSETENTSTIWNEEHSALIFFNAHYFKNKNRYLNVFFSKVTMTLKADTLIVNGVYFEGRNSLEEMTKQTLNCTYYR